MTINDFFEEGYSHYKEIVGFSSNPYDRHHSVIETDKESAIHQFKIYDDFTFDEFIDRVLLDNKFADRWGFKVDPIELSFNVRWKNGKYQPFNIEGMVEYEDGLNYITEKQFEDYHNSKMDKLNIPNKLITITYKDNTIEIYVLL